MAQGDQKRVFRVSCDRACCARDVEAAVRAVSVNLVKRVVHVEKPVLSSMAYSTIASTTETAGIRAQSPRGFACRDVSNTSACIGSWT